MTQSDMLQVSSVSMSLVCSGLKVHVHLRCWHAQGMALDHTELREYTNGMLGHLAETLGEEFAPFLPNAVQAAITSCSQVQGAATYYRRDNV